MYRTARTSGSLRARGRRLPVVLLMPGLVAIGTAVLLTRMGLWRYVGIDVLTPLAFEDLRQVTYTADCARTAVGWNISFGSCDPWQRPYNYPEVWARALAILHLGAAQTSYIGYALIVVFGAVVIVLTALANRGKARWSTVVMMGLAALSPPSLFAMERGNIDIVVLGLLGAVVILALQRWNAAAAVVGAAMVLLKLFPIGVIMVIAGMRQRRTESLVVFVAITGIGLFLMQPQLQWILSGTPQTTRQSFGVAVLPLAASALAGETLNPSVARTIGLGGFVAGFVAVRFATSSQTLSCRFERYRRLVQAAADDAGARITMLAGGGCVLVAYLLGTSWDYRLIFMIPVVAGLLRLRTAAGTPALVAAAAVLAQLYLTFPLGRAVEPWFSVLWLVSGPLLAVFLLDLSRSGWRSPAPEGGLRSAGGAAPIPALSAESVG